MAEQCVPSTTTTKRTTTTMVEPSIDHDEELFSDHTQSMRRAARYCLSRLPQEKASYAVSMADSICGIRHNNGARGAHDEFSLERARRRREAYEAFWRSSTTPVIPEIRYSDLVGKSATNNFQSRFHDPNLPCLVTFRSNNTKDNNKDDACLDDETECFKNVDCQWRRLLLLGRDDNGGKQEEAVNRKWFVETLGAETTVPVRFQPPCDGSTLDDEGRATECETKQVSIDEWIQMLEQAETNKDGHASTRNPYYLKDWHLLLQLKEKQENGSSPQQLPLPAPPPLLYTCPPIFEFDLLNSFLTRFTNGDYKFCYWGPKGSFTSRHSDVLHSFSWSYNVVGTKQWTFFRKSERDDAPSTTTTTATSCSEPQIITTTTLIQKSGQAVFVPSQWQHEVVNLDETISINHNWVTSANLDLCWECLTTEMVSIDKELDAWSIHHDNMEARESMLRGCVGMDVTFFFLMVLVRMSDLLNMQKSRSVDDGGDGDGDDQSEGDSNASERAIEVSRLVRMIQVLRRDEAVQLESRLACVLQSTCLPLELLNVTDKIIL